MRTVEDGFERGDMCTHEVSTSECARGVCGDDVERVFVEPEEEEGRGGREAYDPFINFR